MKPLWADAKTIRYWECLCLRLCVCERGYVDTSYSNAIFEVAHEGDAEPVRLG